MFSDTTASGGVTYGYRVRGVAATGQCSAAPSQCVEATAVGACSAAPQFAGIGSASNAGSASCAINLGWAAALSSCGNATAYSVFRSTDPAFEPSPQNRIESQIGASNYVDSSALSGTNYNYIVRASDLTTGATDSNLVQLSARAGGPAIDGDWFSGAEQGDPNLSA